MSRIRLTLVFLLGLLSLLALWWLSARPSEAVGLVVNGQPYSDDAGYVGNEACKDCHEDQFLVFAGTQVVE